MTYGFDTPEIAVSTTDGVNVVVLASFRFTRPSGEVIVVRTGATSDGVSSPRWAWAAVPPFGAWWKPGVLHDAIYRMQTLPLVVDREVADQIFLEALMVCNVPAIIAQTLWQAVHHFGEAAWIKDRVPELGV